MKKSSLASAIALSLGTAGSASALTVSITQMNFNGLFGVSGQVTSAGTGSFTSITPFFGRHWTATATTFFSATGPNMWAGTVTAGVYSYNFSLTSNQVAWGTLFDWNTGPIPLLNIMTCTSFYAGGVCTGTGTPMQTPPFAGQAPSFNGVVSHHSDHAFIPVPAAAWLMGSGLIGLAGVARRSKNKV